MLLEVAQLIDGDLHDGCLLVDSSQQAKYNLRRLLPYWRAGHGKHAELRSGVPLDFF